MNMDDMKTALATVQKSLDNIVHLIHADDARVHPVLLRGHPFDRMVKSAVLKLFDGATGNVLSPAPREADLLKGCSRSMRLAMVVFRKSKWVSDFDFLNSLTTMATRKGVRLGAIAYVILAAPCSAWRSNDRDIVRNIARNLRFERNASFLVSMLWHKAYSAPGYEDGRVVFQSLAVAEVAAYRLGQMPFFREVAPRAEKKLSMDVDATLEPVDDFPGVQVMCSELKVDAFVVNVAQMVDHPVCKGCCFSDDPRFPMMGPHDILMYVVKTGRINAYADSELSIRVDAIAKNTGETGTGVYRSCRTRDFLVRQATSLSAAISETHTKVCWKHKFESLKGIALSLADEKSSKSSRVACHFFALALCAQKAGMATTAEYWAKKAVGEGSSDAFALLATLPTHPKLDLKTQEALLRQGSKSGSALCAHMLAGVAYRRGGLAKSAELFRGAARCSDDGKCEFARVLLLEGATRKRRRLALRLLGEAAKNRNLVACAMLGDLYSMGEHGVSVDWNRAIPLYEAACDGGSPHAAGRIAFAHKHDLGVKLDRVEFYKLMRAAADGGDGSAQLNLAQELISGKLMRQDVALGYKWVQAAADKHCAEALYMLAYAHCYGKYGFGRSMVKSMALLQESVDLGYAPAMGLLGVLYMYDSSPLDIPRAIALFTRAANLGLPRSQNDLANALSRGLGGAVDAEAAAKWWRKSAASGFDDAKRNLARAIRFDNYTANNPAEAKFPAHDKKAMPSFFRYPIEADAKLRSTWLARLTSAGIAAAQLESGEQMLKFSRDAGTALIRLAADQGHARAQQRLGELLLEGRDEKDGRAYMRLAAKQLVPSAVYWLALSYELGNNGCPSNLHRAFELYTSVKHDLCSARARALRAAHPLIAVKDERGDSCVVCMERKRKVIFIPCGHFHTCGGCSIQLASCPMCQQVPTGKYEVFTEQ